MHEFGITSRIIKSILKVAKENNATRVVRVDLLLGKLTFLNIRQVKMCFDILVKGTILEGSELFVQESEGIIHCRNCNLERKLQVNLPDDPNTQLDQLPIFACTNCGGKVTILKGKECQVKGIVLEK